MSDLAGELRPDEIAAVAVLWERCGLTRPWNDPVADARLALKGSNSTILVVRKGAALAASAMVGHDGHRAWVYYLAVSPEHRKQGLGRSMMTACEAWSRSQGISKLQLMVRTGNADASGFYDAIGYGQDEVAVRSRWLNGDSTRP